MRGKPTARGYKEKVNFAGILEEAIKRIIRLSGEGDMSGYNQAVDDLADTMEPYKDPKYLEAIERINEEKEEKKEKIKEKRSKSKRMKQLRVLQYEKKRSVYKELVRLMSRNGWMPAQFISTDLDFRADHQEAKYED